MKQAVLGIIFSENRQQVLLILRRDVDVWVLPGGGVDLGEEPEAAVIREVFEETGLRVSIVRKVGEYTPLNRLARLTHTFECHPLSGSLTTGPETRQIAYFPINQLPASFFAVHQQWLQDALKKASTVIRQPIHSVTYTQVFKYALRHPVRFVRFLLSRLGLPINYRG